MSQQPSGYQGDGSTNAKVQKRFGNMVKGLAKKATKTTQKFIKETEKDISRISTMDGLLILATKEFNTFFTSFQDESGKKIEYSPSVDQRFKHFCNSFQFSVFFFPHILFHDHSS